MNKNIILIGRFFVFTIGCFIALCFTSCKKMVEVDPPNYLASNNVYDNDVTAIAVLNGMYQYLSAGVPGSENYILGITKFAAISADELSLADNNNALLNAYFRNSLEAKETFNPGSGLWTMVFPDIFNCNRNIDLLSASDNLTPSVKQQLLGELKFMRAFYYYYLVNLYGDIPIITSDYQVNRLLPRKPILEVYNYILEDLKDAKTLLSANFIDGALNPYPPGSEERTRPNKWAASAMLARVYLYLQDWANAEAESSSIIQNTSLFNLVGLNDVFLKNSDEAIWQLQPVETNINTKIGIELSLVHGIASGERNTYLSTDMMSSFETGDQRMISWVGTYISPSQIYPYPNKYKIADAIPDITEYQMVLRLAEQYLIRAEARIRQNNIAQGIEDLNAIRTRARGTDQGDLPDISSSLTPEDALDAVDHERRVELFTEWGDRWLHLKRRGKIDEVMSVITPQKGGSWESYQQWYPIPYNDVLMNVNLKQTQGY
ncbi:MAG: RagB/SusD family nutrient uptake outer membrane protein [Chitinophagaceae bacterium]|nr:RagB/SusD family nutrient uptake outer membrane protein [Chitinophagaceae bacterium]